MPNTTAPATPGASTLCTISRTGESDSIERITHSICTLEFEDHRPLYDWYVEQLGIYHPQQIEFDRLNLTYTLLSKRKLLTLVQEGHVRGWDDPRMPTLAGIKRRGYTPEAIRNFCGAIGVSKTNGMIELGLLEHHVREDLNKRAARVMAVIRPLRVVIDNYPEGQVEEMEAVNNPEDASMGTRKVPFSRVLYIEQEDFREDPPKQYYRLSPGREVRLRYGYFVTCTGAVKNEKGEVVEIHCTYDPATKGGNAPDGRKVKSTIHWVSAAHAMDAEVRLYDNLFTRENPSETKEGEDFTVNLNPNSLEILRGAQTRAFPGRRAGRKPLPVRTPRLLLRRSRFHPWQTWCSTGRSPCATPGPKSRKRKRPPKNDRRQKPQSPSKPPWRSLSGCRVGTRVDAWPRSLAPAPGPRPLGGTL